MEFKGLKDVEKALKKLPKKLQLAAEKDVLRAGARPVSRAAKSLATVDSGLLKKSIGFRVRKVGGVVSARIGPRTKMKQVVTRTYPNGSTYSELADASKYGALVESGTAHSPAKPFIRPALDSTGSEVLTAMSNGYEKALHKVVKRLRKK